MQEPEVKIWNSLATRYGLIFMALIVFAIFTSGWLVYNKSSKVITDFSQERIKHTSNLASQAFYSMLEEVSNDLAVLSENKDLAEYMASPSRGDERSLSYLFEILLRNKPEYFQIRLLNIPYAGREMIRLNKVSDSIVHVDETKLQFKGNRPYFMEAQSIKPHEVYFSSINLNEEFGVVNLPYTPTIRGIKVINDHQGSPLGMIVINVDLSGFFAELNQLMDTEVKIVLADATDQYLFAPNMNKCFDNQLHKGQSFTKDFERSVQDVVRSSKEFDVMQDQFGTSMLYHVEELKYSLGKKRIYLFSIIEENLVLSSALRVRNESLQIIALFCLLALLVALWFTGILSRQIMKVTHAISEYGISDNPTKGQSLPTNRKDEIGMLARTFTQMRTIINKQVDDLKISLEKEQKAIRERDEFLQNMSHELRTPLNAILGLSKLLMKNKPNQHQIPIIQALDRSAMSLSGLMYDVLDHQKLLEGQVTLKYQTHSIGQILKDIHAGYQFEAMNKGLTFELQIEESLYQNQYLTDALRLNQVVTNLVINAIKFTNEGGIRLVGEITADPDKKLKITISDTGIGIETDNLLKIKERFFQESDPKQATKDGFGLGLSIVKQLLSLFKGELKIESEKGKGSVFTILMPLSPEQVVNKKSVKDQDYQLPWLSTNYTVLHLDDDISARELVRHVLKVTGIELIQTDTYSDVLAVLEQKPIDLFITDLMLEGTAIDRLIAQNKELEDCPIIVTSAFEVEKMKALSAHCFQKPFDIDHFLVKVTLLLGQNEFDIPDLESVYAQYDHVPEKISSYLEILEGEFVSYHDRIQNVFGTKDQKEWKAINHKLITHVRGLKLVRLEQILPDTIEDMNESDLGQILNQIQYLLCFIRNEASSVT